MVAVVYADDSGSTVYDDLISFICSFKSNLGLTYYVAVDPVDDNHPGPAQTARYRTSDFVTLLLEPAPDTNHDGAPDGNPVIAFEQDGSEPDRTRFKQYVEYLLGQ